MKKSYKKHEETMTTLEQKNKKLIPLTYSYIAGKLYKTQNRAQIVLITGITDLKKINRLERSN